MVYIIFIVRLHLKIDILNIYFDIFNLDKTNLCYQKESELI